MRGPAERQEQVKACDRMVTGKGREEKEGRYKKSWGGGFSARHHCMCYEVLKMGESEFSTWQVQGDVSKVRRRNRFGGRNDDSVSPSAKPEVTAGYTDENAQ